MKINKLSMALVAAASLLAVSPLAQAQETNAPAAPARPRGMSVEAQMDRIDKAVTLTDAEKPKVKAALEEQSAAVQAARDGDQSEMRSKMKDAREAFNKKMKDILTPDQYTKFEAMPRPGRRAGGNAGGGGAAGGGAGGNQ